METGVDVEDAGSHADSKLDEALEETFPASDPLADTVAIGIRTGDLPPVDPGDTNALDSVFS